MGSSIRRIHLDRGNGTPWCFVKGKALALGVQGEANCEICFAQREKAPGPNQILKCSRCKQKKPGAQFPTNPSKASGRHGYCRPCFSEWESANRKAKRRAVSAREKRYYHANPFPKRAVSRRNNENKPKAVYARQVIRNEIKRGRLKRGPCEVCGSEFAVHGHHDDYDQPLIVRWLCGVHHKGWHDANGPGANIEGEPVLIGRVSRRAG